MRKKLLAVCFVLAAVLSLMTIMVMADNDVVDVGGVKYTNLQEAIDDERTTEGSTIKLLGTITSDKSITVNKSLNFVLTNDSPDAVRDHFLIFSKGSLVIESGAVHITGGTIYGSDAQTVSLEGGSLTVTDTTITNSTGGGIGVKITQPNGNFTMESGAVGSASGCAIYQSQMSDIVIKDGTITGAVGIVAYQGTVGIGLGGGAPTIQATSSGTSRTIMVDGKSVPVAGIALDRNDLVQLDIQNGMVLSDPNRADAVAYISAGTGKAKGAITGGVFSSNVKDFVPGETHAVIQAGDYWLVEAAGIRTQKALVIRNGIPKAYPSLSAAIEDANKNHEGGDTVVLLDNDDSSSVSAITKNMTLELGKYEIKSPLTVSAEADATININEGSTAGITVNSGTVIINGTTVNNTGGVGITVSGQETSVSIKGGSIKGSTSAVQVNSGTVAIDGATVESSAAGVTITGGTVTINGTTVKGATNGVDVAGGTLTVQGNTTITGTAGIGVSVSNENTEFTITGGTIEGKSDSKPAVQVDGGTVTVNGTTITGAGNGIDAKGGTLTVQNSAKITGTAGVGVAVSSGTVTINGTTITGATNGVEVSDDGSLTITSGTITGKTNGVKVSGGEATINGGNIGSIEDSANGATVTDGSLTVANATITGKTNGIEVSGAGSLTVTSGTITGTENGVEVKGGSLTVANGTITGVENGVVVSGGEAKITGGTIGKSNIGDSANGVAVSGGETTITGGSISGSTYGISVESTGKLTFGKAEDGIGDNGNITVTGPTALHFKGTFGTGDIKIYSGTFNSTDESNMAVDTAEADLNGFIYGGKFTPANKKLDKKHLAEDDDKTRWQENDGTVVTIDGGAVTITFNANGGEFAGGASTDEVPIPLNEDGKAKPSRSDLPAPPTRPNYVFDDWYTKQGDGEGEVFRFDELTIETDLTLYAHWKQIFTITFDAGDEGQFGKTNWPPENYQKTKKYVIQDRTLSASEKDLTASVLNEEGEPVNIKESEKGLPDDPDPRDGVKYTFGGWFTDPEDGEKIDLTEYEFTDEADSLVKIDDAAATLYAHWGYKITFDPQGGSFEAETLESGKAIRVTNKDNRVVDDENWTWPALTRDGWRFDGWFEEEGTERVDKEDTDFKAEKDTTLYAHWTQKATITLTADPNMLTSEDTGVEDEGVTITLTADYAEFVSDENGSVDTSRFHLFDGEAPAEASVTDAKIVVVEGVTIKNKVEITLDKVPQKAGRLTIKVDEEAFQDPPPMEPTTVVDVTYRIDFDPDGGTFTDEEFAADPHLNTDINGKLASLPEVTRRDTYYHDFAGWFIGEGTDHSECTKIVIGEESAVFTKNTTVHAHWDQLSFTVTFDAGEGGKFADGSQTRTANTDREGLLKKSDLEKIPERTDYTFDGWYTVDEKPVDENTKFTENSTIHARWMKDSCEITFYPNGGKFAEDDDPGTVKTETVKGGEALSKLPDGPAIPRPGHAFAGWFIGDEKTGACKGVNKCEKVDTDTIFKNDTAVHAHWGYEVTFYLNDGVSQDVYDTKVTGIDYKLTEWPAEPTRSGFVFAGWYTDTMNGDQADEEGYVFEEATAVYARWSQTVALKASPDELLVGGETKEITLTIETADATFVSGLTESMFTLTGSAAGSLTVEKVELKSDGKEVTVTLSAAPATVGTLTITVDGAALSPRRAQPAAVDIAVRATVTFDPREGTVSPTSAKTGTDGKLTTLPTPTRDGYTFDGWYTAATGGEKVTTDTVFTSNATIYAHWKEKSSSEPEGPGTEGPGTEGPGTEGPGDSKGTYSIQIPSFRHGSVSTTHTSAEPGTWVTLTVIPESDYDVSWVYVDQAGGASVSLSQSGRRYSFTMPASDVTVDVRFTLRPEYNNFVPPQTQPQYQTQGQSQKNTQTTLPTSVFKPVTSRPAAALWDLQAGSWAYPAAQWAYQNGYLDTAADGTFRLNDTVSHMQLWRIMARWQGESALDDNSVTQWARKTGASKIGTASGAMTRQNMVEYLYQCYFLLGGNVSVSGNLVQYRDSQQIVSASAKNAWIWAVNKGIISGTPDGALNPNGVLNRGEFASILMRLCQTG